VWDFLGNVADQAAKYELGTWAGIINIVGFLVLMTTAVPVSIAETAMNRFSTLVEGSRKYRALKRGLIYEPVYREPRPKPAKGARLKSFAMVAGYLILCVVLLAAVDRVAD
jgi:hypothetical protein